MSYKIIVDSSCDLPQDIINQYDIKVVPLTINFGEEQFEDRVDLSPASFYEKLEVSEEMPKTSQATPDMFINAFREVVDKGDEVICITLSSKASGTFQSANIAKEEIGSDKIHLIDSKMLCMGMGMFVIMIARLVDKGKSSDEILDFASNTIGKIEHLFCVDTLRYLKKGGRIKASSAAIGEILNIKPILNVDEGITQTIGKVRGKKKVVSYFLKHMEETMDIENTPFLCVAHAMDEAASTKLIEAVKDHFNLKKEFIVSHVGPTIGTHSGPGALSIFYIKK